MAEAKIRHEVITPQAEIDCCLSCAKPDCAGGCYEQRKARGPLALRANTRVVPDVERHWQFCPRCGAKRLEPRDAAERSTPCRCGGDWTRYAIREKDGAKWVRLRCLGCGWTTDRAPKMSGEYGNCKNCGRKL